MDSVIAIFIEKMEQNTGEILDLSLWTQLFSHDVIGELAFGQNWGLLESGHDQEDLMELVYMTLSSTAALGWTPMHGKSSLFSPVRYFLNSGYLAKIGKKLHTWPLPLLHEVWVACIRLETTSLTHTGCQEENGLQHRHRS